MRTTALLLALFVAGCFAPPAIDADLDLHSPPDDCNDEDPTVHPDAGELCNGIDDDCDGTIDEGYDEDADGYLACGGLADCDDTAPAVHPEGTEVCDGLDNDCNGGIDDGPAVDPDLDGYCDDVDCDDEDDEIHPGVIEDCDGVDQDCNGVVDDGFDGDGDGFSPCGDDCDDEDPEVHPGVTETCDGVDQDCDGTIDEPFDADGDGVTTCAAPPDCDDGDSTTWPGAAEQCDGIDNDCDSLIDEDTGIDLDLDGWTSCAGDCDDTDQRVSPDGTEIPDGLDNDCDTAVDEGYEGDVDLRLLEPQAEGAAVQDLLGQVLASGDFDGDGYSDVVSGMPIRGDQEGGVAVFFGAPWTAGSAPATWTPGFTVSSADVGAYFGHAVALGDLDGDGIDDLVVGEPQQNWVPQTGWPTPRGRVWIWFGGTRPTGDLTPGSADVVISGVFGTEQCGTAVALGDFDGDGTDDLALSCPWYQVEGGFRGRTAIFLGRATWTASYDVTDAWATVVGEALDADSGQALATGDFDGDGRADLAIGAPSWSGGAGRIGLHSGTSFIGGEVGFGSLDARLEAPSGGGDRAGGWLGSGDADSDGKDDLLVGNPDGLGGRGSFALIPGASPLRSGDLWTAAAVSLVGADASEQAGYSAAVADLDADGVPELLVAIPGFDGVGGDSGRIAAFEDPTVGWGGQQAPSGGDYAFLGEAQGDFAGGALVVAEDVGGDGAPDLIVGSPHALATAAGRITVVPGY